MIECLENNVRNDIKKRRDNIVGLNALFLKDSLSQLS